MSVQPAVPLAFTLGDRVSPTAGYFRGDLGFVFGFTRRNRRLYARVSFGVNMLTTIPIVQLRKA